MEILQFAHVGSMGTLRRCAMASVGSSTLRTSTVVVARREAENVQNVPVSIQLLTGRMIREQAITRAENILNKKTEPSSIPQSNGILADFGSPGYDTVDSAVPSKADVMVRDAFGSR